MNEKAIKEKLKQKWIHVLVTFEVLGKPKEHVNESLKTFLAQVKKDERIAVINEHIGAAVKQDDEYFSAFAEADALVKNFDALTWLCINFTPAALEIVEPDEFALRALDVQNHFNDLLARLHTIGTVYKSQTGQLEYLKENFTSLVHNILLLSLSHGPKTIAQVSKDTTLVDKLVEDRLAHLVKEKKVVQKKGVYSLA
jgi:hypothetical protein